MKQTWIALWKVAQGDLLDYELTLRGKEDYEITQDEYNLLDILETQIGMLANIISSHQQLEEDIESYSKFVEGIEVEYE